jgi:hypothetical protein
MRTGRALQALVVEDSIAGLRGKAVGLDGSTQHFNMVALELFST